MVKWLSLCINSSLLSGMEGARKEEEIARRLFFWLLARERERV